MVIVESNVSFRNMEGKDSFRSLVLKSKSNLSEQKNGGEASTLG